MPQKLSTKNVYLFEEILAFVSIVTVRKIRFFRMCISFSLEKKKPKKEVVVVSTASLKTKSCFAQPHHASDRETPFYERCLFSKENIKMTGEEKRTGL